MATHIFGLKVDGFGVQFHLVNKAKYRKCQNEL